MWVYETFTYFLLWSPYSGRRPVGLSNTSLVTQAMQGIFALAKAPRTTAWDKNYLVLYFTALRYWQTDKTWMHNFLFGGYTEVAKYSLLKKGKCHKTVIIISYLPGIRRMDGHAFCCSVEQWKQRKELVYIHCNRRWDKTRSPVQRVYVSIL